MSTAMTSRERIRRAVTRNPGELPDRVPIWHRAFWSPTLERWKREGLPEGIDPAEHFGADRVLGVAPDTTLRLPVETIEEGAEYRIYRDGDGVVYKAVVTPGEYSPPQEIDATIRTAEDWRRLQSRLLVDEARWRAALPAASATAREEGVFVYLQPRCPAWWTIRVLGMAHALEVMATDPEWIEEMVSVYTDFNIRLLDSFLARGGEADAVWINADLCYRNGMLFSPRTYRNLFMPAHRRMIEWAHARGMSFWLHCDGQVTDLLPMLIEAGFDAIQPLEVRCGNDVREYKRQYGTQICFFGNISADVIARGDRCEIESEIVSKMAAAKEGGGYMFHIDHSVPPTISLESYRWMTEVALRCAPYS